MSASLFSSSWYKVSDLKVRLRKHATIHRHVYRETVWYVLQDHVTGQFQRFTPQAYQLIGLMDGHKTLQQIWDIACHQLADELPTQDEVIALVGQLNSANLVQTDALPNIEELQRRQTKQKRNKLIQQLKSPLSIKIPLIDPDAFLTATMPFVRWIYSWFGGALWLVTVLFALVLATLNWPSLTENVSDRLLAVDNLLLMMFVYPPVKLAHELGHGYAVKRWGGEVHEMGVMLLLFMPVPYVDASSASAFRHKYQRMLVGAVGVLGELLMAALAMIVWASVEPGMVRAIALNVMVIGGFSTLLFNGNPLLRFDAYYVLSDYLEIPNLGNRGNAQVAYLLKRYCFAMTGLKSSAQTVSESIWLVSYAVVAYIYRLFVMMAISMFIALQYFFVGVLLATWSVWSGLFLPVIKVVSKPMTDPQLRRKRSRIYSSLALLLVSCFVLVCLVPFPYKTYSQGVLYVPSQAYVKASVSGFVTSILQETGSQVVNKQPLVEMQDADIQAKVDVLRAQLNEAKVRYQASVGDRSSSDILLQEIHFIEQDLHRSTQELAALTVESKAQGEWVIANRVGLEGRYLSRGEMIGYVIDYQKLPLMVMIAEDDIDRVNHQTLGIELRFASDPNQVYLAQKHNDISVSTQQLPSEVLSTKGGGDIILDPNGEHGLQSYQRYFRIELDIESIPKQRFDERVYVLFEHPPEPLIWRWYRNVRRVFLRNFDV